MMASSEGEQSWPVRQGEGLKTRQTNKIRNASKSINHLGLSVPLMFKQGATL